MNEAAAAEDVELAVDYVHMLNELAMNMYTCCRTRSADVRTTTDWARVTYPSCKDDLTSPLC